jgi:hypothetical protein
MNSHVRDQIVNLPTTYVLNTAYHVELIIDGCDEAQPSKHLESPR